MLEESLTGFDGAVLLVTHDRYFLDQVATTILAFDMRPTATAWRRAIVPFASLAQWEAWRAEQRRGRAEGAPRRRAAPPSAGAPAPAAARSSATRSSASTTPSRRPSPPPRRRCATAVADSERPENASDAARLIELLAPVDERRAEVDRLYARWAELESKREG